MELDWRWVGASYLFLSQPLLGEFPIVIVGWTLEFEMLFYLIFAAAITIKIEHAQYALLVAAIVTLTMYGLNPVLLEFAFGAILALVIARFETPYWASFSIFSLGVLGLLGSALFPTDDLNRVIVWGIPSILLVWGAVTMPQVNSKLLKALGDSSYETYLIQVLTIPVFYKMARHFDIDSAYDYLAIASVVFTATTGFLLYFVMQKIRTATGKLVREQQREQPS